MAEKELINTMASDFKKVSKFCLELSNKIRELSVYSNCEYNIYEGKKHLLLRLYLPVNCVYSLDSFTSFADSVNAPVKLDIMFKFLGRDSFEVSIKLFSDSRETSHSLGLYKVNDSRLSSLDSFVVVK